MTSALETTDRAPSGMLSIKEAIVLHCEIMAPRNYSAGESQIAKTTDGEAGIDDAGSCTQVDSISALTGINDPGYDGAAVLFRGIANGVANRRLRGPFGGRCRR